ncbi:uncharacterized protein TNCV_865831 [Trichonephila clavipes]|nr:uncharacterized protein TNCV_865831 [Trichonephila clavipes]
MPALTLPCLSAYSNSSGFSGSVTATTVVEMCSGKASIGSIMLTDEKCRNKSRFYTFQTGCVGDDTIGERETMVSETQHGQPLSVEKDLAMFLGESIFIRGSSKHPRVRPSGISWPSFPGLRLSLNERIYLLFRVILGGSLKGSKKIIDCSMGEIPSSDGSWNGEVTGVDGKGETGVNKLNMPTKPF